MLKKLTISLVSVSLLLFSANIFAADDRTLTEAIEKSYKVENYASCSVANDVLKKYLEEYYKNRPVYDYGWGATLETTTSLRGDSEAAQNAVAAPEEAKVAFDGEMGAGGDDFSDTNLQVAGVDESDIIKTDGKYIYYVSNYYDYQDESYNNKNTLYILDVNTKKLVRSLKIPDNFNSPQIYLSNGKLVLTANVSITQDGKIAGAEIMISSRFIPTEQKVYTIIFNVSDSASLSVDRILRTDGYLQNSRIVGDYLYLIGVNYVNIPYYRTADDENFELKLEDIIPSELNVSAEQDSSKQNYKVGDKILPFNYTSEKIADCEDINFVLPDSETSDYYGFNPTMTSITAVSLKNVSEKPNSTLLFGNNSELYMSRDNLYLTSYVYSDNQYRCAPGMMCTMLWMPAGQNTGIHKFGINGKEVNYSASAVVVGSPLSQYSMDEHNGDFRIITSKAGTWSRGITGRSISTPKETVLNILDKDLKVVSTLDGLGKGEDFKSSRFMGDKLYLVTFETIDPFFVIDVADSKNPKVLGELKIPGYSTYLHPYDDNHVIGIGFDTKENNWGGVTNAGVKVELFNIDYNRTCESDNLTSEEKKSCESGDIKGIILKSVDSAIVGGQGSSTELAYNPRMFVFDKSRNKLIFPIEDVETDENYTTTSFTQGAYVFEVKTSGIEEIGSITHLDKLDIAKERINMCQRYNKDSKENCVDLVGGGQTCTPRYYYVPDYCDASKKISDEDFFKANRYLFEKSYVKRSLYVGNEIITLGNSGSKFSDFNTLREKTFINFGN